MSSMSTKIFTPSDLGYRKNLILVTDQHDTTLFKLSGNSGIDAHKSEAKLYKYHGSKGCNEGYILRRNLETGAETSIGDYTLKLDSDIAERAGMNRYSHPGTINARRVKIDDCGTKLDLITYKGKVINVLNCLDNKIGTELQTITPFTRKWIKKYIDYLGKVR